MPTFAMCTLPPALHTSPPHLRIHLLQPILLLQPSQHAAPEVILTCLLSGTALRLERGGHVSQADERIDHAMWQAFLCS